MDTTTGRVSVVRDLWYPSRAFIKPVVWSEVFARCDHPSVAVRWSSLEAVTEAGELVRPTALGVRYQSLADGGCTNTNSERVGPGVVQRTATARVNPAGHRIELT